MMGLFDDEVGPVATPAVVAKSATISPCGMYRYALDRVWGDPLGGRVTWVMLNPSTADAEADDPTIRRCIGFSKAWGFAGLRVVNLYALRSTAPKGLWRHADPVGPHNDFHLEVATTTPLVAAVVAAWGANARPGLVNAVRALLRAWRVPVKCLGRTISGSPKHPLYVKADTALIDYIG